MVERRCCHPGVAEDLLSAGPAEFGWLDSATSVQFALRPAEKGSGQCQSWGRPTRYPKEPCHDASLEPHRTRPRVYARTCRGGCPGGSPGRTECSADPGALRSGRRLRRWRPGLEAETVPLANAGALFRRYAASAGLVRCPARIAAGRTRAARRAVPRPGQPEGDLRRSPPWGREKLPASACRPRARGLAPSHRPDVGRHRRRDADRAGCALLQRRARGDVRGGDGGEPDDPSRHPQPGRCNGRRARRAAARGRGPSRPQLPVPPGG